MTSILPFVFSSYRLTDLLRYKLKRGKKVREGGSGFHPQPNIREKIDQLLAVNTASAINYREEEFEGLPVPVTTPKTPKNLLGSMPPSKSEFCLSFPLLCEFWEEVWRCCEGRVERNIEEENCG